MALSEIDRNLLQRCLNRRPRAWEDFVDRFMGLVIHVVNHTAQARGVRLAAEDREDLCAEVFLAIVRDDFAVLRNFREQSSLATYLTVIARRVVVRQLLDRRMFGRLGDGSLQAAAETVAAPQPAVDQCAGDREQVERLLSELHGAEAEIVRLFHIEGKSYREISAEVGMPENTIGPILSRARDRMRRADVNPTI